jgi:hypothetical protein
MIGRRAKGSMKTKIISSVLGLLAFASAGTLARPARASCCDDFWSCAAAVATAGASCAVRAAQEEIERFVKRVEQTRDDGKRRMEATAATMDREVAGTCAAEHRGTQQAHAEIALSQGVSRSTIARGEKERPQSVNESLRRAQARLDGLQAESMTAKSASTSKHAAAITTRQARLAQMNTVFNAAFVAPLTGLVAPLDPISAVATIALLSDRLLTIERETQQKVSKEIDEFDRAMATPVQELRALRAAEEARAAEARSILQAVKALAENPTEGNRQNLERLLNGGKPPAPPQLAPGLASQLNAKTMQDVKLTALPALKQALVLDAEFAKKVNPKPTLPFDKQASENRTRQGLTARLDGKSGKALEDEKQKLLAEARARYPKDAKTRQALEKLIEEEVKRRQAPPPSNSKVIDKPLVPLQPKL